ncbi:MAG: precorrin-2 C(20)-methyltransferase [Minwuia sp.]|nr:precorrin-2 C(20)-methyltransferase [Minwuia sp.]
MSGTLYGVGVGPGDPELMTYRAWRIINAAAVVAFIGADGRPSRARSTASAAIRAGARLLPVDMPMRADPAEGQAAYDVAATVMARELAAGHDVAFLCEGDPLLYGSFIYLMARLQADFPVEVVPGLPSFVACAAELRQPLARRSESFGIVPGTLSDADLRKRLSALDSAAIIKVGRHARRIGRVLADLGLLDRAMVVEEVSTERQTVRPFAADQDVLPYFATIIIPAGDAA